jgi:hypothetical protein
VLRLQPMFVCWTCGIFYARNYNRTGLLPLLHFIQSIIILQNLHIYWSIIWRINNRHTRSLWQGNENVFSTPFFWDYKLRCFERITLLRNVRTHLTNDAASRNNEWVPATTLWRVLRLRIQQRSPIRKAAVNIMNRQLRKADKEWSSSLVLGEVLTNPHRKYLQCHETLHKSGARTDLLVRGMWGPCRARANYDSSQGIS